MKIFKTLFIVCCFMVIVCSCGGNSSSSDIPLSNDEIASNDNETSAVLALYDYFGVKDKNTGISNSFSIVDTVTVDGVEYYHGRWSTLTSENDGTVINSSLYKEFFLTKDLKTFYEGTYDYSTLKADFSTKGINIK